MRLRIWMRFHAVLAELCMSRKCKWQDKVVIIIFLRVFERSARAVLWKIGPRSWPYEQRAARSVQKQRGPSSLLQGPQAMFVYWICRPHKTKRSTSYGRFHGNGPYGKNPTRKEPMTTFGFTSRLSLPHNKLKYFNQLYFLSTKKKERR